MSELKGNIPLNFLTSNIKRDILDQNSEKTDESIKINKTRSAKRREGGCYNPFAILCIFTCFVVRGTDEKGGCNED